jgi:hypothetical protein
MFDNYCDVHVFKISQGRVWHRFPIHALCGQLHAAHLPRTMATASGKKNIHSLPIFYVDPKV